MLLWYFQGKMWNQSALLVPKLPIMLNPLEENAMMNVISKVSTGLVHYVFSPILTHECNEQFSIITWEFIYKDKFNVLILGSLLKCNCFCESGFVFVFKGYNRTYSDYCIPHLKEVLQDSPDCGFTWGGSGCNILLVVERISFKVLGLLVNWINASLIVCIILWFLALLSLN